MIDRPIPDESSRRARLSLRISSPREVVAAVHAANTAELIALAAVAATPFALFVDYRVGAPLYRETVHYRPLGESGGALVAYEQLVGVTALLWIVAGVASALCRPRSALRNVSVLLLAALLLLAVAVTAVRGELDSMTAIALSASLAPLLGMVLAVTHPAVGAPARRQCVFLAIALVSLVVGLTILKRLASGELDDHLGIFLFGPDTDTGIAMAALIVLLPASAGPLLLRLACGVVLTVELFVTETRGALLAAIAGACVLGLLLRRIKLWAVAAVVVGAVSYVILFRRNLTFGDTATSYRRENLSAHWHYLLDKPVFGWGVSRAALEQIRAAHNTLLAVANATGIVGLVLWLAAWFVPAFVNVRDRLRNLPLPAAAGIAGLTAVLVGWNTTGSEVLIYSPVSTLLPLVLAVAVIGPTVVASRRSPHLQAVEEEEEAG